MKKYYTVIIFTLLFALHSNAQIAFDEVNVEGWVGTGQNEAMFILDFDSDPIGMDSTFAWGIQFETDSINGDEILSLIAQSNPNFTYTVGGVFLDNIIYSINGQSYTNPNSGWFSILESADGENWEWNLGITDNIGNAMWYGMVVMNTETYEAEINVPILTNVHQMMTAEMIDVYPNPASDHLNIKLSAVAEIIIANYAGQIVYNELSKMESIDISNWDPGMYIIRIVSSDFIKSQKVIIK